jgi:hypothetical protein
MITNGTAAAPVAIMSVRDFRDLVAWQLSDALRLEVIQFTSDGRAVPDFSETFSRLWNLAKSAERVTTNLMLAKLRQAAKNRKQRRTARDNPRARPAQHHRAR